MDSATEPITQKSRSSSLPGPAPGVVVIALGASAGGMQAIGQFFAALPRDSGLGYVVITHVMPDRVSLLPRLLEKVTVLPVSEIADGQRVERDHVYVPPPWAKVWFEAGLLRLTPAGEIRERGRRIDHFFESVAHELGPACAGVVLSGAGSDGSSGIQAIARTGGLTLVQDPATAKHDSMPHKAIATGAAQHVLAPERMPAAIAAHFAARAERDRAV